MKKYSCPSCGAEVSFQSSVSIFSVCPYCRSTLIRKDMNLETLGKMSELKDDATPLQIGTSGKLKADFWLIGRVRLTWEDGLWNEWFARFSDGREAWLAEAQGFYMMSFQVQPIPLLPAAREIKPEQVIQIGQREYTVDDMKNVIYSYAEGELPFLAPQGAKAISIDLRGDDNHFASISYNDTGTAEVFVGEYLDFEQFQFQNLRQVDGW